MNLSNFSNKSNISKLLKKQLEGPFLTSHEFLLVGFLTILTIIIRLLSPSLIINIRNSILMLIGISLFTLIGGFAIIFGSKKIELESIKKQKRDTVYNLVINSNTKSIFELSKALNLGIEEVKCIISEIIELADRGRPEYKQFKNAYLDSLTNNLILKQSMRQKVGHATNIFLNRLAPEERKSWNCIYCNSLNENERKRCSSCGANK